MPSRPGVLPLCLACQRLRVNIWGEIACTAFPTSIPSPIREGRVAHTRPFPGDQGIRFEPDYDAPTAVLSVVLSAARSPGES